MAKNRWLLMIATLLVTVSMSAQFPGGFGNFGQMARRQAQQKAAEAEKNYQKGNEFLEAKKYDKAFAAYEKAAENGHAGAQYNLATFYLEGKVVPQDNNKAVEYFEKAANQGLKDAQYNLAAMYHQGVGVPKDEEKAEYWAKVYKDIIKLEPKKEEIPSFPFPMGNMGPVNAAAPSEDEIYDVADVSPKFPGGEQALASWLMEHLSYPETAFDEGIQGKVLVSFVIANEGSVVMPKIAKSVHPLLDAEALRVLLSMPKWSPGMKKGQPVYTRYNLPVTFRLTGDSSEKNTAEDGTSTNASSQDYYDKVLEMVEENPQFPGGEQALMTWLSQNLVYPRFAQENGLQGRVLIQFVVNKDGSIVEPSFFRSVHPILDAEAMRVTLNMPKWSPGKKDGKPVRVRFTMPINFKLQ